LINDSLKKKKFALMQLLKGYIPLKNMYVKTFYSVKIYFSEVAQL